MKKTIHNIDGFVAFSGENPEIINLITREIVPIMRTLEHSIDVALDAKVERNENSTFVDEHVFTAQTPLLFDIYIENLMYIVKRRLVEAGRYAVIRALEDSWFSLRFEYTDRDSFSEETNREIVILFKDVGRAIEYAKRLVLFKEGDEDIDIWTHRELLMADD